MHVMIIDDHATNRELCRFMLSEMAQEVTTFENGEGVVEAMLKMPSLPDVILLDVMMPKMDGYELTQHLQQNTNTNHIPIIMLTSKAMQEDKIDGISSGADAYLTKPFHKEELLLRMKMLIAKRKQLQEKYAVNTVITTTKKESQPTDKNLVFLKSVVDVIHNHIEDSNFGPTELAKSMAMSDSQLYRKLKAISNSSTAIFIRKVRLEKGKELLKTTDLSISEIAYAIGFNDPNWFSKTFKEEFKQSPSEFRN